MIESLNNYDWEQAFTYADFVREDVKEVIAMAEGENDGDSWIGIFKLKSGDFAFLTAGCDYTGWDCRASGSSERSDDLENLIRMKMGLEDRSRLGKALPEDAVAHPPSTPTRKGGA
jgi:hypothetical protein